MPSPLPSTLPKSQRQWRQIQRGAPKDCLALCENAPVPTPGKGEVLVKIAYATTTPSSWKLIMRFPFRKNAVPELDATGRVADPNGSGLEKGAEVICLLDIEDHLKGRGVLTEYALFRADRVFHLPSGFTLESAPGLAGHGMVAYKAFTEESKIQPGARVFINGGTTACGISGIQIAKLLGASNVTVSCSPGNFDFVKDLGADEAIDYRASPIASQLSTRFASDPFDIVLDCIGYGSLYRACPAFLKPEGIFITIALSAPETSWPGFVLSLACFAKDALSPTFLGGVPRKFVMSPTPPTPRRAADTLKWAGEGKLKHFINSVHASNREGVLAAYERGMTGHAKGKVLINMEDY